MIELKNICKDFPLGNTTLKILVDINLTIESGEFVSIMGASGSGKSTLLNIIGCLDRPTCGSYLFNGKAMESLSDDELSFFRNRELGFVYQNFNLISYYTALKNVEVPLSYQNSKERSSVARKLLERVGLSARIYHKPSELSGGEKQRVAIARALSTNPSLLLADEPTGALDSKSGEEIIKLFTELHREGKTVIMVTHDRNVAKASERIILVKDGRVVDEPH